MGQSDGTGSAVRLVLVRVEYPACGICSRVGCLGLSGVSWLTPQLLAMGKTAELTSFATWLPRTIDEMVGFEAIVT